MYLNWGMFVLFDFTDLPSPVGDLSDDSICSDSFFYHLQQVKQGLTVCSWYSQLVAEVHSFFVKVT